MRHFSLVPKSLLCALLFIPALNTVAQDEPLMDIRLADAGSGVLEVRLRPDGPFDGVLSSCSFTIRWPQSSGASLSFITPVLPLYPYCAMAKSDVEQDHGIYRYQIFAGLGLTNMGDNGYSMAAAEEVVLFSIQAPSGVVYEIANDDFTSQPEVNGNYFVSLNGIPRTGVIYSITTNTVEPSAAITEPVIAPNPTNGPLTITLPETMTGEALIEVTDATGRIVRNTVRAVNGKAARTMDLTGLPAGVYTVKVNAGGQVFTQRVVLAAGR